MAGSFQSLFGRPNKATDEPPEGRDGRTKRVTDVAASHDRVLEILSHEMDSALSNTRAVEDLGFAPQHEPYLPGQFIRGIRPIKDIDYCNLLLHHRA